MDEDEVAGVAQEPNSTDEGKSWSDIIPESDRKKIEEEEEQKKQLELYLPPRNRKTVKKVLPFSPSYIASQMKVFKLQPRWLIANQNMLKWKYRMQ